jgi:hypothetical protein
MVYEVEVVRDRKLVVIGGLSAAQARAVAEYMRKTFRLSPVVTMVGSAKMEVAR